MNLKQLLFLNTLITLTVLNGWGYEHTIVNCTQQAVPVHLYYSVCEGNDFTLKPGERKTITNHLCILEGVDLTGAYEKTYETIHGGGSSGSFNIKLKPDGKTLTMIKTQNPAC